MSKDTKYKNKEWLYQKYIVEKLSTHKIAEICGYNQGTIHNWLKNYNIKTRTISEAVTGKLHPDYCPLEERLWVKVDKKDNTSECWPWTGCKLSSGYGQIGGESGGRMRQTHAVMYEYFYKDKVKKDEVVHHICGNKFCCNPFHLVKMGHSEHISFHNKGVSKGVGENNNNVKLTWEKIRKIREMYNKGECTQQELAKKYGIGQTAIEKIVNNKRWKE